MKKVLIAIAALIVSAAAYAQGTVQFNTRIVGDVDAPVTLPGGAAPSSDVKAYLYMVGAGGALTLVPGSDTPFRTDRADRAQYVTVKEVAIPGVATGGSVTLTMRAYNGATYETSTLYGQSPNNVTVNGLGGGTLPPPSLTGLQGFVLTVPEPSTIALGAIGAAALLFRRRK